MDFVLNDMRYRDASILLARENFACGSSREHAVWALQQYGFKCVIAPSFADIFYNNSFNNGLLPIQLNHEQTDALFEQSSRDEPISLTVDLPTQSVTLPDGSCFGFDLDAQRKNRMLKGLDEIGLSLEYADEIKAFERNHQASRPWLFENVEV